MSYCWRDGNGSIESRHETEYDINGNELSVSSYGKDALLEYKLEYKYDRNGNCIGRYTYDEQEFLKDSWECEYKYDKAGKQNEIRQYNNGILKNRYINVFDKKGNLIKYFEY